MNLPMSASSTTMNRPMSASSSAMNRPMSSSSSSSSLTTPRPHPVFSQTPRGNSNNAATHTMMSPRGVPVTSPRNPMDPSIIPGTVHAAPLSSTKQPPTNSLPVTMDHPGLNAQADHVASTERSMTPTAASSSTSTPRKQPPSQHSNQWNEWTQQLTAYTSWANSQLKKRPGQREVTNLREDLRDGVLLCDLIEIVSGETLAGVCRDPRSVAERRENIERALAFMRSRRIRMHTVAARDVVDGNAKSVMRLILALAAHFKPSSVREQGGRRNRKVASGKESSDGSIKGAEGVKRGKGVLRNTSTLAAAQDAAAALASIRRDAASVGQKLTRFERNPSGVDRATGSVSNTPRTSLASGQSLKNIGSMDADSHRGSVSAMGDYSRRQSSSGSLEKLGWKAPSSAPTSAPMSALSSRQNSLGEDHAFFYHHSPGSSVASSGSHGSSSEGEGNRRRGRRSYGEELEVRQEEAWLEGRKVKGALLRLQKILLKDSKSDLLEATAATSCQSQDSADSGTGGSVIETTPGRGRPSLEDIAVTRKPPLSSGRLSVSSLSSYGDDDDEDDDELPVRDRLVISQSRLQQLSAVMTKLKEELGRSRQECLRLEGKGEGLQSRLGQQEDELRQTNSKLLQHELDKAQRVQQEKAAADQKEEDRVERENELSTGGVHIKNEKGAGVEESMKHKENAIASLLSQLERVRSKNEEMTRRLDRQTAELSSLRQQQASSLQQASSPQVHPTNQPIRSINVPTPQSNGLQNGKPHSLTPAEIKSPPLNSIRSELDSLETVLSQYRSASPQRLPPSQSITINGSKVGSVTTSALFKSPCSATLADRLATAAEELASKLRLVAKDVPSGGNNSNPALTSPNVAITGKPIVARKPIAAVSGRVLGKAAGVKALCYRPESRTPSLKTVRGALGELTLADFKAAFSLNSPNFRYQFKGHDSEFQEVVKVEISDDSEIIPSCDGKVVAWVEEVFIR